jgi:hypothetical protein
LSSSAESGAFAAPLWCCTGGLRSLEGNRLDIPQPNVNNDGGYTGAMRVAAMARHYNKPISHGNRSGFQSVPQPDGGYLHVSQEPGPDLIRTRL